jgi:predicted GH43/DUF377 family glycosyl hydrolase
MLTPGDTEEFGAEDEGIILEPGASLLNNESSLCLASCLRDLPRLSALFILGSFLSGPVLATDDNGWAFGPFIKHPQPILRPRSESTFLCPIRGTQVRWEEQNVYNPAAVVRNDKVYLFYRADDVSPDLKWGRTCRIGMATSEDGIHFTRHPRPVVYPDHDAWQQYEWEGGCEDLHLIDWTPISQAVWPAGGHEAGAIALQREDGILLMTQGGHPSLGAWTLRQALIDRNDLRTVLEEQRRPFLYPEHDWEKQGFVPNTTVANTLIPFKGRWLLYYGAADHVIGLAEFTPKPNSPVSLSSSGSAVTRANRTRGAIDLRSLLEEMLDRSHIAEFPQPEFVCRQASSYNRLSQAPGNPEWFAGADFDQFYGSHEIEGRKEWIMLDAEGPGAVTRWWQTQYHGAGIIRIYLDGRSQPTFEDIGDQLVGGDSLVAPPLAATRGGGRNLYLPIPFQKHIRITFESPDAEADFAKKESRFTNESLFYNVNYVQYPAGTKVKTLTQSDLDANQEWLAELGRELLRPDKNALPIKRKVGGCREILLPGRSMSRTARGPGAIAVLRLKISAQDIAQAMRSTVITAAFDGDQTVWAPVGEFFGSGLGINPYQDWWRAVGKDGWMTCWWPMPFKESAQVSIMHHGTNGPVEVQLDDLGIADWDWTDRKSVRCFGKCTNYQRCGPEHSGSSTSSRCDLMIPDQIR